MIQRWRPLVLAGALNLTVGASVVLAQSLIVRNTTAPSTIDAMLNAMPIGSATVDGNGNATFAVDITGRLGKAETNAYVFVDACPSLVRVLLAESIVEPPAPAAGCTRKPIWGLLVVRTVTTLLVDVGRPEPAVWLRQGPAPPTWLGVESETGSPRVWTPAPTGLVLSASGGFAPFGNATAVACGSVATCASDAPFGTYSVAAAYWIKRFVAAEVSYVEPARTEVTGDGAAFRFRNTLHARVLAIGGKVGAPVGPMRFYGQAARNYHGATSITTQTIDDTVVTVDGATQTIKGGSQTFELKTEGWGWSFGGGAELWLSRYASMYGEMGRAQLKGADRAGGEARIDDHVTFVLFGVRLRIAG